MAKVIAAMVVTFVLALSPYAGATCAWLLWVKYQEIDPDSPIGAMSVFRHEYGLESPHETRRQCEDAGRTHMDHLLRPDALTVLKLEEGKRMGRHAVWAYPAGRRDRIVKFEAECWPDTIDPRGPKGEK